MIVPLLVAATLVQLPVAEQNRRMAAYTRLPVRPCDTPLTPRDAIWTAAEAEGRPVDACVELPVAAIGDDPQGVYLNSQRDYRDPRSVTVVLTAAVAGQLRATMNGASLGDALIGKRLTVRGRLVRQRIDFTGNGRPTGKYYYQTHVQVVGADQIARPVPPPF